jgi:hypothetical protein
LNGLPAFVKVKLHKKTEVVKLLSSKVNKLILVCVFSIAYIMDIPVVTSSDDETSSSSSSSALPPLPSHRTDALVRDEGVLRQLASREMAPDFPIEEQPQENEISYIEIEQFQPVLGKRLGKVERKNRKRAEYEARLHELLRPSPPEVIQKETVSKPKNEQYRSFFNRSYDMQLKALIPGHDVTLLKQTNSETERDEATPADKKHGQKNLSVPGRKKIGTAIHPVSPIVNTSEEQSFKLIESKRQQQKRKQEKVQAHTKALDEVFKVMTGLDALSREGQYESLYDCLANMHAEDLQYLAYDWSEIARSAGCSDTSSLLKWNMSEPEVRYLLSQYLSWDIVNRFSNLQKVVTSFVRYFSNPLIYSIRATPNDRVSKFSIVLMKLCLDSEIMPTLKMDFKGWREEMAALGLETEGFNIIDTVAAHLFDPMSCGYRANASISELVSLCQSLKVFLQCANPTAKENLRRCLDRLAIEKYECIFNAIKFKDSTTLIQNKQMAIHEIVEFLMHFSEGQIAKMADLLDMTPKLFVEANMGNSAEYFGYMNRVLDSVAPPHQKAFSQMWSNLILRFKFYPFRGYARALAGYGTPGFFEQFSKAYEATMQSETQRSFADFSNLMNSLYQAAADKDVYSSDELYEFSEEEELSAEPPQEEPVVLEPWAPDIHVVLLKQWEEEMLYTEKLGEDPQLNLSSEFSDTQEDGQPVIIVKEASGDLHSNLTGIVRQPSPAPKAPVTTTKKTTLKLPKAVAILFDEYPDDDFTDVTAVHKILEMFEEGQKPDVQARLGRNSIGYNPFFLNKALKLLPADRRFRVVMQADELWQVYNAIYLPDSLYGLIRENDHDTFRDRIHQKVFASEENNPTLKTLIDFWKKELQGSLPNPNRGIASLWLEILKDKELTHQWNAAIARNSGIFQQQRKGLQIDLPAHFTTRAQKIMRNHLIAKMNSGDTEKALKAANFVLHNLEQFQLTCQSEGCGPHHGAPCGDKINDLLYVAASKTVARATVQALRNKNEDNFYETEEEPSEDNQKAGSKDQDRHALGNSMDGINLSNDSLEYRESQSQEEKAPSEEGPFPLYESDSFDHY